MRVCLALCLVMASASAMAENRGGYVRPPLSGGEVAVLLGRTPLRDWSGVEGRPDLLFAHDDTGQWYRMRFSGHGDCRFAATLPVRDWSTEEGVFGQGLWVQNSRYPYNKCIVRSVQPVDAPF